MVDWSAAAGWASFGGMIVTAGVREVRTKLRDHARLEARVRHLEKSRDRTSRVTAVLIKAHSRALSGMQAGRTAEETLRDLLAAHRQAVEDLANLDTEN